MTGTAAAAAPARRAGPAGQTAPRSTRLAIGVLLVLAAAVLFAGSRFVASGQQHCLRPGSPPRCQLRRDRRQELPAVLGHADQQPIRRPAC